MLLLLLIVSARYGYSEFSKNFSLANFHLEANGVNANWNLEGDFVVVDKSSKIFTQLGYLASNSSGLIQSKRPLKRKKFKVFVDFTSAGFATGGGLSIWVGDKINLGNYYGRNSDFKGFGVVYDNKRYPSIHYENENAKGAKSIKASDSIDISRISIFYNYPKVSIYYLPNRFHNERFLVYEGSYEINPMAFLSIVGYTDNGTDTFRIVNIFSYPINASNKAKFVPGDAKRSNHVVLIFGVITVLSLIYYMYKQKLQAAEKLGIK